MSVCSIPRVWSLFAYMYCEVAARGVEKNERWVWSSMSFKTNVMLWQCTNLYSATLSRFPSEIVS